MPAPDEKRPKPSSQVEPLKERDERRAQEAMAAKPIPAAKSNKTRRMKGK